jgi:hypothetical protein
MTYYDGYVIKAHNIHITDIDGNAWKLCEEARIVAVLTNRHTSEQRVRVRLYLSTGESVTVNVARDQVITDPIRILTKYGLTLAPTREYTTTLAEILLETESSAKRLSYHDRLGWSFAKGKRYFYAEKVLGDPSPSTYLHRKKLRPEGSYVNWQKGIRKLLHNRPELQLALTIGACAPIAALLQREHVLELVSIFALIGQSGTGKTTMLTLMSAVWGRIGYQNGIVDTLLDTQNYFFASLGKKHGFPCFIDETSAQPGWDFTGLLYQISMRKEKGRCNPDGTQKPVNHWSGTIIFTGERSLFNQTNGNEGLFARLVEFPFQWTENGEEAEAITDFCSANHGTAYVPLIEYLLQLSITDLRAQYDAARDTLLQEIAPLTSVDRRLMKQYAMLLMTSRIIAKVWQVPIDEPSIIRLLVDTHQCNRLRNRPAYIYEAIIEQFLANLGKFPDSQDPATTAQSIWGERSTYKYQPCVWIIAKHFEDFLKTAGATISTDLLKQLHSCGHLIKVGDRFKVKHGINRAEPKCYCIPLGQVTTPARSSIAKKKQSPSSENIKKLMSDEEDTD